MIQDSNFQQGETVNISLNEIKNMAFPVFNIPPAEEDNIFQVVINNEKPLDEDESITFLVCNISPAGEGNVFQVLNDGESFGWIIKERGEWFPIIDFKGEIPTDIPSYPTQKMAIIDLARQARTISLSFE
ncbi:MAG TPA: hypothetical protein V6D21_13580 [Candidatus Obscuribacterales bacterium]